MIKLPSTSKGQSFTKPLLRVSKHNFAKKKYSLLGRECIQWVIQWVINSKQCWFCCVSSFVVRFVCLFVWVVCLFFFFFFFQNCKYKSTQRSQYQPLPEPYHVTFSVTGVTSPLAPFWLVWSWAFVCVLSCFYFQSGGKRYLVYTNAYHPADLTGFRHLFFFWYWQTAPLKEGIFIQQLE